MCREDFEVMSLEGERCARKDEQTEYRRHGRNHGSVELAGQRVGIDVARVRGPEGEMSLSSYRSFQDHGHFNEVLFRRVLGGISCRDYEAAADAVPGAIGLSSSTVSRRFKQESAKHLKELSERDLSELDLVSLFVDGKSFAEDMMVMAIGVVLGGEKVTLGFCQTTTENARAIGQMFEGMKSRGLQVTDGLLVVIDGGKGIRRAVEGCVRGSSGGSKVPMAQTRERGIAPYETARGVRGHHRLRSERDSSRDSRERSCATLPARGDGDCRPRLQSMMAGK
jgi:putative transposase